MPEATHYAVIGYPVEHSLSPKLFTQLFSEFQVSADYRLYPVAPPDLPTAIVKIRSGKLSGLSVTLPHKRAICSLVDELDPDSGKIQAVNCVIRLEPGRVRGCNTDGVGFRRAVESAGPRKISGTRVLLLGTGGAGRAAAFACASAGAGHLTLANRTLERASQLARDLVGAGSIPSSAVESISLDPGMVAKALESADLVVQATRVGLGDSSADPLPASCHFQKSQVVLEMVYRPLKTALLRRVEAAGGIPIDGLWMLIHQALEQFRLWTGRIAPLEMADRLHAFLAAEAP
ncbi:MAG TPA: shikimate dehydrogenase [Myxococcales bacterium]